jgi:NAD(P)-dependent dehydrogenase (short-subunit alcohol dehydrogenase family)
MNISFLTFLFVSLPLAYSFDIISFDVLKNKNVLVVGGSGRVGGSVTTQLLKHGAQVIVGGTRSASFTESKRRWSVVVPGLDVESVQFRSLNREDTASIACVLDENRVDLVVHTAGPFQGKVKAQNGVLEACLNKNVPYIDVCDDYCTATAAKTKYSEQARVPCIVSTGCWPGVSSLMAKQLVSKVLQSNPTLTPADLSVNFSFFTAGSGGAGVTLLVATFLILAEKALIVVNGRRREVNAMEQYSNVHFGDIVGTKEVAHLNLLETASVHDTLGVGNTQSLFGTAPKFWNALLGAMAKLPSSLLANEEIMRKLSIFSIPVVRLVDYFAGATNAMRCDVFCEKIPELRASAIYAHENLEPCVGECVVAFVCAVLSEMVPPGIWFPEEAIAAGEDIAAVLSRASVGAHTKDVITSGNINLTKEEMWGEHIPMMSP